MSKHTNTSIEGLRVYQSSRSLEDHIYELVKALPAEEFYRLGNDLRRSSGAISHYITEAHKRYSYSFKLEALHLARTEAEQLRQHLEAYSERGYGATQQLQDDCTAITRQSWGLIKYFKQRQAARQAAVQIKASDALVAARS